MRTRSSGVTAASRGSEQATEDERWPAKHGLGERGTPWCEQDREERCRRWSAALAALDALDGSGACVGPASAGAPAGD